MDNQIEFDQRREFIDGRYYITLGDVRWPGVTARVNALFLDDTPGAGDFYEFGPFIGEVVADSYDAITDTYLLVKVAHPMAWMHRVKFRLAQQWQWLSARLIYTLAVWGLAAMPEYGERIGWYCVRERWAG